MAQQSIKHFLLSTWGILLKGLLYWVGINRISWSAWCFLAVDTAFELFCSICETPSLCQTLSSCTRATCAIVWRPLKAIFSQKRVRPLFSCQTYSRPVCFSWLVCFYILQDKYFAFRDLMHLRRLWPTFVFSFWTILALAFLLFAFKISPHIAEKRISRQVFHFSCVQLLSPANCILLNFTDFF